MTGVSRVFPVTFGWEDLPETISLYQGDRSVRYREPVPGVLVQLDGGWLLLHNGFTVPLVRHPFRRRGFHGRNSVIPAELFPGAEGSVEVPFAMVGVSPDG